ncbi:MAG: AsmA family protein [Gammaproteobacteria bacterium]|nr:MAG: AsmA family protein [Gammaproteobacteria bacterium]
MRFPVKLVLYPLLLLALLVVAGVYFLDVAVERGIETVGTRVARVEVALDGAGISLYSGQGALRGLRVANPAGYRAPYAVRVGQVQVALKPLSVLSDRVVVRSVVVQGPEIHYEKRGGKTNLDVIRANVESTVKRTDAGKRLQIDSLIIRDAKVYFYEKRDKPPRVLTLKEIHLQDLGKGPEGLTGAELTRKITDKVIEETAAAVAKVVGLGIAGHALFGVLGLPF